MPLLPEGRLVNTLEKYTVHCVPMVNPNLRKINTSTRSSHLTNKPAE